MAGVDQDVALIGLGAFALLYQIRGGLKAVALTDIVQVTLLVLGGLVVAYLTLEQDRRRRRRVRRLRRAGPARARPFPHDPAEDRQRRHLQGAYCPGIAVLVGGMWIANLSYWGFNQYIIQRALAAKSLPEAQKGVIFAAFLKLLMPVIIVLPGIAAVVLAPGLAKPDQAYPTMMRLLPTGLLGPGLRGAGRGDHRLDRLEDQFDRDDLHARHLRQDDAASSRVPRMRRARKRTKSSSCWSAGSPPWWRS